MRVPFNINDNIWVKLTDEGRAIHKQHYEEIIASFPRMNLTYEPPKEDENGWSCFQAWDLIHIFGPHIYIGRTPPFSTEVELEFPQNKKQEPVT